MSQENREQPMEEGQEEIPVEPVQDEVQVQEINVKINPPQPQQQEEPRHPPIEELQPFDEPRGPSQTEELSMVHRKINRVLGRTDELSITANRVNSTFKSARPKNRPKSGHSPKGSLKSRRAARRGEVVPHL
ncbi:unnamed protein product [Haemonchus placei]|uniref:Pinin n=1 Tax=Haemonchus placei TaxID=6290 RepID=A0A0N4W321_HAEPC|nr:unnamed protein product [Haemonchus placei]